MMSKRRQEPIIYRERRLYNAAIIEEQGCRNGALSYDIHTLMNVFITTIFKFMPLTPMIYIP
jgi:hypothetical protein